MPEPTVPLVPNVTLDWLADTARWPVCDPSLTACLNAVRIVREQSDGSYSVLFEVSRANNSVSGRFFGLPTGERVYRLELLFDGPQGPFSAVVGAVRVRPE